MNSGADFFYLVGMIAGFLLIAYIMYSVIAKATGAKKKDPAPKKRPPDVVPPVSGVTPAGTSVSGTPVSGTAIHKTIPSKKGKPEKPQQIVSLLSDSGSGGKWVCPVCDAENPFGEAICCVCHNVKGR